ncbi:UNVERIFIED_CONTAM: putative inactive receptor kinase [Sesamum radiatum]|uniref:Inactive receptor kinase n=1 Tax=Sesamum radiatum TaxID=300843 RepID=A0AAW2JXL3_SESRA
MQNGVKIVVKRLKYLSISEPEFKHQMEFVGNVRHENVAALRACYSSANERLMLYDYYDKGSVFALLHGKRGTRKTRLSWETRLRIGVGAARGIAHIHQQDGGKLVHGDIKPSNIFLNGKNYSLVSDVGLPKLMNPIRRYLSLGYRAPEVKDSTEVSQASGVYSFGVVLLELVPGKPPQFTMIHGEVVLLVNWIHILSRDYGTRSVIDEELMYDRTGELIHNGLVRHQNDLRPMVRLLQIAVECVTVLPERRPRMLEVGGNQWHRTIGCIKRG